MLWFTHQETWAMGQMERVLRHLVLKQLIPWTTMKREFPEGAMPKLGKPTEDAA